MDTYYFDANATTPLHPEARAEWLFASNSFWQNPASPSTSGAQAHTVLEECRRKMAKRLGAKDASRLVFTSGATEANNAVIAFAARLAGAGRLAVCATEHPSVLEPARHHAQGRLDIVPVDASGLVRLDALEELLAAGKTTLVSVAAVNNETGVIQPMKRVRELCLKHGARLHSDATQWFGKLPAKDLAECDYVTGSAHKFGGTKGVGFLLLGARDAANFCGQLGGGQENHHRAGTSNLAGIAAMVAAFEVADEQAGDAGDRVEGRDAFEARVWRLLPGVRFNGADAPRIWNTSSLTLARHAGLRWLKRLNRHGFAVGIGSACASIDGKPSHVLAAMGLDADAARRTLRVSALPGTTKYDWLTLAEAISQVAGELANDPWANGAWDAVITP